jgi:hypothetical protein
MVLYTAEDYLYAFEPHVLDLMVGDREAALQADTEKAHQTAINLGYSRNAKGYYPEAVWLCVYR